MRASAWRFKGSRNDDPSRRPREWLVYLALALPITILLNLAFINLHGPDDFDHVRRAYTVFHHPFQVVTPPGHASGAMIDQGLTDYIDGERPIVWHGLRNLPNYRAVYGRLDRLHWKGTETFTETAGALSYLPVLYVPQGVMLEIGRVSGATIEDSVRWARLANGLVAIALCALGLYLLPAGGSLALLLLLLPRSLLSFASNSADPILYGLALIVIALGLRGWRSQRAQAAWTSVSVFVAAAVRPPIAALALPALVHDVRQRRRASAGATVAAIIAAAFWMAITVPRIADPRCHAVGTAGSRLMEFALGWPALVWQTFSERGLYFYVSFVGHFGLGNALDGEVGTPLPNWIYGTAIGLFLFALWQEAVSRSRVEPLLRVALAVGAFGYLMLTFFALYMACSAGAQPFINGIQGRYFVPALFAFGAAISGLAKGRSSAPRAYIGLLILWVGACAVSMTLAGWHIYDHFG